MTNGIDFLRSKRKLRDEITAARAFERDKMVSPARLVNKHARLVSIGIFEGTRTHVLLCSQNLPDPASVPAAKQLKAAQ